MSYDEKAKYYGAGGIEVLDVIRAKLTPEEFTGYLKGNAIKYLLRMAFKGSEIRDAEKAANYTRWLIASINKTAMLETGWPEVMKAMQSGPLRKEPTEEEELQNTPPLKEPPAPREKIRYCLLPVCPGWDKVKYADRERCEECNRQIIYAVLETRNVDVG